MIATRPESSEVLYPAEEQASLQASDLILLKQLASNNTRRKIRFCTHRTPSDYLHEMFIIHARGTYIRPHKHTTRSESIFILEGKADLVLFHDDGQVRQIIHLGDMGSDLPFYYRLSDPVFHTLIIHTPFLVFYEATTGPFCREETTFAEWSVPDLGLREFVGNDIQPIIETMVDKRQ